MVLIKIVRLNLIMSIVFCCMSIQAKVPSLFSKKDTVKGAVTKQDIYKRLSLVTDYPVYVGYITITDIRPGQLRYSQQNVDAKIKAAVKKGWATQRADGSLQPQFFNNTSIIPEDQALPVVAGPKHIGLVLVDGHHDTISSLQAKAATIPIKVVANLSNLSTPRFWQEVAKRNFVYPYDIKGQHLAKLPTKWSWGPKGNLQDDSNRYFAAISARKCAKKDQPANESTGADYPVWVKVGKDIPFIEFMISDALTKAGLHYTPAMGEDFSKEPLKSFAEAARTALRANPIKGLKLVPERTYFLNINGGDLCGYEGGSI